MTANEARSGSRPRCAGERPGSPGLARASCSSPAAPTPPRPLAGLRGARRRAVVALHLNYGLRPDSDGDEETCGELCAALGIELVVERPQLGEGNVQAEAREARYAAAERLRARPAAPTGSPPGTPAPTWPRPSSTGSRPRPGAGRCSGCAPRRGARGPAAARRSAATRRAAREEAGLPFRDDPTQRRAALRAQPDPERGAAGAARDRPGGRGRRSPRPRPSSPRRPRRSSGSPPRRSRVGCGAAGRDRPRRRSPSCDPALRRLALRRLAERAAGRPVPLGPRARGRDRAARQRARGRRGRARRRGGGAGRARARPLHARSPRRSRRRPTLPVPGSCRFGAWEVRAELARGPARAGRGPDARGARRRRARRPARRAGLARGRPHAARSGSAARSPSRTCSPTARSRARCGARCRWSLRGSGSPGSPASRSRRSSPLEGRRPARRPS